MPDSLGELLDQLEGVVDGATPGPWQSRHGGLSIVTADDEVLAMVREPSLLNPDQRLAYNRPLILAAVNLLTPLVEVVRAAEEVRTGYLADMHDDDYGCRAAGGDGCLACLAQEQLGARLEALSSALSLALEEKK